MSNNKEIYRLAREILGLDRSTVNQMGVHQVATQLAHVSGAHQVLRCDADSGQTQQYCGDLIEDIQKAWED